MRTQPALNFGASSWHPKQISMSNDKLISDEIKSLAMPNISIGLDLLLQ
jgi:hypothetical protein